MNIAVKGLCAQGAIGGIAYLRQNVHMAKRRHFLRMWREHRGKTLVQVAEFLHMTHGNLSKIERGLVPYNEELLDKLAELYNCDAVDLIIRDPTDPIDIWSVWENAKPGDKRKIVSIAQTIVNGEPGEEAA